MSCSERIVSRGQRPGASFRASCAASVAREPELGPIDDLEMLVDAVTGEGRRWVASADEDEPPARRDLVDRLCHDLVEIGLVQDLMVVVEDEREGRRRSGR